MKILTALDTGTSYHYEVHLDESKTVDDPTWQRPQVPDHEWVAPEGAPAQDAPLVPDMTAQPPQVPDPAWVASYDWPKDQAKEVSLREMALLCEVELAQRQPAAQSVKLAEEGMTLDVSGKVKKPKG